MSTEAREREFEDALGYAQCIGETDRLRALFSALQQRIKELGESDQGLWKQIENQMATIKEQRKTIQQLEAFKAKVLAVVNEQAEDEGLWSVPAIGKQRITEAYLQQELRRLHAVIETGVRRSEMRRTSVRDHCRRHGLDDSPTQSGIDEIDLVTGKIRGSEVLSEGESNG